MLLLAGKMMICLFSALYNPFLLPVILSCSRQRATSLGIDRHYHSVLIEQTSSEHAVCASELKINCVYRSHLLSNSLYITLRSHIKNV